MKKLSISAKETEQIAKEFLDKILNNNIKKNGAVVVGLSGDLGVGKTAFTQYIGKHLGVKSKITSPTFVILKKYPVAEQARYGTGSIKNFKYLIHIDAYRLKNEQELEYLGWRDILNDKENLIFIEWPENVKKTIPKNAIYIHISHEGKNKRKFKLK